MDGQKLSDLQSKTLVNIPVINISIHDITQIFGGSSTLRGITVPSTNPSSRDCAYTFLCQAGDQSVCKYTDGSVYGKGVKCGASAAVQYHPSPSTEICYKSSAVGRMVSTEECEVDGIILGINMITQYYNIHSVSHNNTTSYIISDSISAIESIDKIDPDLPLHK